MTLLQDGVIAFFAAVGIAALVWLIVGALLRETCPAVPGAVLALPVRGEAYAMESDLRELLRLRRQISGARIVLVDRGLSEPAREIALALVRQHRGVELVTMPPEK